MIIEKLIDIVDATQQRLAHETSKLDAIQSIREMLSNIDFNAEIVPIDDKERLSQLLSSLKGKPLSMHEKEIVHEIVDYKTNGLNNS